MEVNLVETDRTLPFITSLQPLRGPLEVWDRPAAELCESLVNAAEAAIPYLLQQISRLCEFSDGGWIVEGERVHPELSVKLMTTGAAQGVFIVETNEQVLYETLMQRLPGFKEISETRRRKVAEVDQLYNLWLVRESGVRDLPSIEARPWETLSERVVSATAKAQRASRATSSHH